MELSEGVKERLGVVVGAVQTTFHWGFVPLVLYLGKLPLMLFLCPHAAAKKKHLHAFIVDNNSNDICNLHRLQEGS